MFSKTLATFKQMGPRPHTQVNRKTSARGVQIKQ